MKAGQFDIVHSYTAKPNIYGSIAAKWAGIKKIYPTVNGLGYAFTGNSTKNKMVRAVICMLYKWAFSGETKVFFQNRAIITTDAPGCKETVNGKNGFLIEPRNSDQLAEKMIWMIEHPNEVKHMGAESRKYAEEKFDVEKVNQVMLETMEIQ